jgi:hypothetical protein
MIPEVSFASRCTGAGARPRAAFFWMFFQVLISERISRSNVSRVSSSPTVRTMTPPDFSGRISRARARRRARSSLSSILRDTPTWSDPGMYTRKRPGGEMLAVTRGPLVLIGSLETCTRRSCPFFTTVSMGG